MYNLQTVKLRKKTKRTRKINYKYLKVYLFKQINAI